VSISPRGDFSALGIPWPGNEGGDSACLTPYPGPGKATVLMRWITCRLCIIAGDISPIDVITHLPIMCEDRDIPYIYVPSKEVRAVLCSY